MRGVFNDFASEINRSIGFYSSINRSAKIKKIVGMGNGFKLPGLQKFLQQNLNNEVGKLTGLTSWPATRSSRPRNSRTTSPRSPSPTVWGFRAWVRAD